MQNVKQPLLLVILLLFVMMPLQFHASDLMLKEQQLTQLPPDTTKAKLLIELGKYYCSRDFEKSLLYLQKALLLSAELNYREGVAASLLWQGRAYYYKDDYPLAGEYIEKARTIFENLDHQKGRAECYFASGTIHFIYGNHLNAIKDFQSAAELSRLEGDVELESTGYLSLGNLHIERDEPVLAMEYLRNALRLTKQAGNQSKTAIVITSMGRAYDLMEKADSALMFFNQGLETRIELDEKRGIASSKLIIGKHMLKNGEYDYAITDFKHAQLLFTELKDDTGIGLSLLNMAIAMNYQGMRNMALEKAHKALLIAQQINNPKLISEVYTAFVAIKAHNENYREALRYSRLNSQLKDSLANANKEKVIRELEIKFQTARKDDEINLLKAKNEIQAKNNLMLLFSIAGLALILVLLLLIFRVKMVSMRRKQKLFDQENTIQQQQNDIRDKEQQLLKEQLEANNREMASKALEMLRTNETISSIIEKLEELARDTAVDPNHLMRINQVVGGLEAQLKDNSWNEFEKIFKNIHTAFFQKLLKICPDLSPSEIKVAAFLKLNLSTKEIAAVTYKSESGVKSTRYRLRKKLELQSDDSLVPFLMRL